MKGTPTTLEAGDVFLGKYRVERVIGEGGAGTVYAARHLELDEVVAIKVLRPSPDDDVAIPRFLREARLAAKMKSSHVVRVSDVARLPDGSAYMVMEHLEGRDLGRALTDDGPLPIADALEFVLQACEALAEAHAAGVVHRDIKPANLFCVTAPGGARTIKLLDFGIARSVVRHVNEGTLTGSLAMIGSPRYMAPEQFTSSREVDLRADVWALGITLFELLTGQAPFAGQNLMQLCSSIQRDAPRALRELRPDAPPALEEAVARCLAKDRLDRFATALDLAHALRPLLPAIAHGPTPTPMVLPPVAALTPAPPAVEPPEPPTVARAHATIPPAAVGTKREGLPLVAVGLLLLVPASGVAAYGVLRAPAKIADPGEATGPVAAETPTETPEASSAPPFAPEPPPTAAVLGPDATETAGVAGDPAPPGVPRTGAGGASGVPRRGGSASRPASTQPPTASHAGGKLPDDRE